MQKLPLSFVHSDICLETASHFVVVCFCQPLMLQFTSMFVQTWPVTTKFCSAHPSAQHFNICAKPEGPFRGYSWEGGTRVTSRNMFHEVKMTLTFHHWQQISFLGYHVKLSYGDLRPNMCLLVSWWLLTTKIDSGSSWGHLSVCEICRNYCLKLFYTSWVMAIMCLLGS